MQTTQQRNTNGSDAKQAGTSSSTGSTQNSEVLSQLQGKGPDIPQTDLGAADSGSAFADMAGGLLDSIAPAEGSAVKLKITGAIPLYKTPGVEVTFKPTLEMGVERKFGKMVTSMGLSAGVEVSAGVETWLFDLKAALEANFKGTIRITGDNGLEVFDEFLLSLRYIIESACNTVSMPDKFKQPIVSGIMSDADMKDTIEGMDEKDKVQLDLEASIKGSASAGALGASASGSVKHSFMLQNDGNDELTVNQQNTVAGKVQVGPFSAERKVVDGKTTDTLAANKDLPILGQTVKASLKVLFVNEVLNKVHLSASLTKDLTLEMLNDMLFGDEGWLTATKNAVVGGIESLNAQIDNPLLKSVAGKLGSSPTSLQDASLSSAGEQIDDIAKKNVDFDGKLSVKISTDLIWQSGKGLVFKITVATNNSTSIGFGGNKIEVTQNDRLMMLTVGNTGLDINFD